MKNTYQANFMFVIMAIMAICCGKKTDTAFTKVEQLQLQSSKQLQPGLTVSELRNTKVLADSVYTTLENGENGKWKWDKLDKKSKDNTGTILVTKEAQVLTRILAATDTIKLKWFGLSGEETDQTTSIQNAINASEGKILILSPGTYFSKKLHLVSNITIVGNKAKLRNIQGDGIDNIFISMWGLSNVEINGLEIALNGIKGDIWAGTSAIQMQNCNNIHIHHSFIHDNTYVGIRLTGGNSNIRINNNFIENTDTGIHANNTNTNVFIISNIISKGTSEGITVYGYSQQNIPYNFLIDSNIIQYKHNSFGINIPYAKLGTIAHNTINNCLGGIMLHDVVSVGREDLYTSDMTIHSNAITNTDHGIIFIGDRTTVTNNYLENIQLDGINVNNYSNETINTQQVTISNNTIVSPALAGGGRGGISVRNLTNSNIDHNIVRNSSKAFSLRFDGNCENLTISENNFGDGILQSTITRYNKKVLIQKNTLPKTYFPALIPTGNEFKLVVTDNLYTTDTAYNTAPDDFGSYNDLNSFNIRSCYSLAAGTIKKIIPSWVGRIIQLKSTATFYIKNGNNINLKGNTDATILKLHSISLYYDGNSWNEVARTF